jgi:hypothetical protein
MTYFCEKTYSKQPSKAQLPHIGWVTVKLIYLKMQDNSGYLLHNNLRFSDYAAQRLFSLFTKLSS